MTAETQTPVTKEAFFKLPRGAQLLVAYALINDVFTMQLQKTDDDMVALVGIGWLSIRPTTTHGIVNGEFSDAIVQGFEGFENQIMASITENEMERYIARKGKSYPWLW